MRGGKKGRKEEDKNREEISRRERIAHTQRWINGKRERERKWKMTQHVQVFRVGDLNIK